jgi:hypothetical protein
MSWHSVKPFIAKLILKEAELSQEREQQDREREVRLEDYRRKVAERERKRAEKLALE